MKEGNEYAVIRGLRYRCKPVYASKGLDEIAQFFYDTVLTEESRISTLVGSFGLPIRVVENILADLLERNYATLDVQNGRIIRIENVNERPSYNIGDELLVWQDDITGAFLPASLIKRYVSRPFASALLYLDQGVAEENRRWEDFIDAPNALIIGSLAVIDPSLSAVPSMGVLDTLVEKQLLDEMVLYLPILNATLEGEAVPLIHASNIPSWLSRVWSTRIDKNLRFGANAEPTIARAHREASRANGEASPTLVETCQVRNLTGTWMQSFSDVVGLLRVSIPNTEKLKLLRNSLESRVRSVGAVSLTSASLEVNHLQEMWMQARRFVIVVTNSLDEADMKAILASTVVRADRPIHLIILTNATSLLSLPARRNDWEIIVARMGVELLPGMIIADGTEVRLAAMETLLHRQPVLSIRGAIPVRQSIIERINEHLIDRDGGWWVREQIQQSPDSIDRDDRFSALHELMGHFVELNEELELLVQRVSSGDKERASIGRLSGDDDDKDTAREEVEFERTIARLMDRAASFCEDLPGTLSSVGECLIPLPDGNQLEVVNDVLELIASSSREHEVELWTASVPLLVHGDPLVTALRDAIVNKKWRFYIVLGRSKSSVPVDVTDASALEQLKSLLPESRFRISISDRELFNVLILDSQIVSLSGDSWFHPRSGGNCAFIVESARLVQQLRQLIIKE